MLRLLAEMLKYTGYAVLIGAWVWPIFYRWDAVLQIAGIVAFVAVLYTVLIILDKFTTTGF